MDEWLNQAKKVLFEGVVHRQVVMTVPKTIRPLVLAEEEFLPPEADPPLAERQAGAGEDPCAGGERAQGIGAAGATGGRVFRVQAGDQPGAVPGEAG